MPQESSPKKPSILKKKIWKFPVWLWLVVAFLLVFAIEVGSGENSSNSPTTPTSQDAATTQEAATTQAASTETDAPDVAKAVAAIRSSLPKTPFWKGVKIKGSVVNDHEVCVDLVITKESAATVGGLSRSHIVVQWSELTLGEAQDGSCVNATATNDKAIEKARAFYMTMDSLAIQLDEAINKAQDGNAAAQRTIETLSAKIHTTNDAYSMDTGIMSVGGNELASAATTASEAAADGDVAQLAKIRGGLSDTRIKLADEAIR